MSIFGKLFKKKEDDFSFDSNDSFSSDTTNSFGATTSTNDPFGTPDLSFSSDPVDPLAQPAGTPDPFGTPHTASTPMPSQHHMNPLPPIEGDNGINLQSRGSQIAQDYINKQQATAQPTPATNPTNTAAQQTHSLEMINLKLDAIKSQLEMLNQRLQKVENEPKKLWR